MKEIKPAVLLVLALAVICGGLYPALLTVVVQAIFPEQAGGSILAGRDGQLVGSRLVGQPFAGTHYFWPRPSATTPFAYNPAASGGANLGPTNRGYLKTVEERVDALRNTGVASAIPADLVQASASGLDPHLSVAAALVQAPRVAEARGLSVEMVRQAVAAHTEDRQFGLLGEPRVNVLLLNLDLDGKL